MFNYKNVVDMKLIITNLYTLLILAVCDAIVLLSVKWAITIDVLLYSVVDDWNITIYGGIDLI